MRNSATTVHAASGRQGAAYAPAVYVLSVALCAGLFLASAWAVLRVFSPEPSVETAPRNQDYSMVGMQSAMDWREVSRIQDDFVAMGSRSMGQPGAYAAEEYIRRAFEEAGLEIHEQENWTVAPRTRVREIYLADGPDPSARYGQPLSDVQIYPFMPNHLQPIATPDQGVVGELALVNKDTLRTRKSFRGCIGLVDVSEGCVPDEYAYNWSRYAQLGLQALIIAHPKGFENVPWQRAAIEREGMVTGAPVNFPRLAAEGPIFQYVGKRLRLRVNVRFEEVRNATLVGILRAKGRTYPDNPNPSAILVLANYDACSILPDKAPGVAQAVWPATMLALARGMAPYRDSLVRDVVFVAFGAQMMAHDGDNNLLRLLDENIAKKEQNPLTRLFSTGGPETSQDGENALASQIRARIDPWEERLESNAKDLEKVSAVLRCFDDAGFLSSKELTIATLDSLGAASRDFTTEQVRYVLNTILFELSEPLLQAKLAAIRADETRPEQPALATYLKLKTEYDRLAVFAGYSLPNLLDDNPRTRAMFDKYGVRERCRNRFLELRDFHERQARRWAKDVDLISVLAPYRNVLVFENALMPAYDPSSTKEVLTVSNAFWVTFAQMRQMVSLMAAARQRIEKLPEHASIMSELSIPPLSRSHHQDVDLHTKPVPSVSTGGSVNSWTQFGYLTFGLANFDRALSYQHFADPAELPYMRNIASLKHSLAVVGETLLDLAHGDGHFAPIQVGWAKKQFSGRVLASGIGQSMMPQYPMKGAVLGSRPQYGEEYSKPGYYICPFIMTDPYGRYEIVNSATDFWQSSYVWANGYSPVAAAYDEGGRITWIKDEGEDGQRVYKSVNLDWFAGLTENITVVMFRAAPVAFLDTTNPQNMQAYAGIRMMDRDGLSAFSKECLFKDTLGIYVDFIEPDKRFYAALESGTQRNELAKVIRGFLVGKSQAAEGAAGPLAGREIDGEGYLAADTPILERMTHETATSMLYLNGKRLELQDRHHMADAQTKSVQETGEFLLRESEQTDLPQYQTTRSARQATVYAMLNHPVLRESVVEAVVGILWYLALLIPFLYFFEKLVFCYSDIRRQITVQAVVFLAVFGLLRLLHPAFEMVRSSLMILLGFVIVLISGGMSVLFSSKFSESIEDLRKKRGQVDTADVNRLGVMGSAFMLGLNNMHRRKVRTWLTCGTLTLVTFAMISFTSVNSDIVDESTAIGKASYQGLLLKRENFKRFKESDVFALRTSYEDPFKVCIRRMYLGVQHWEDRRGYNPEIEMTLQEAGLTRRTTFSSILQFSCDEPLQQHIRMLTNTPWFTEAEEKATDTMCPAFIPDRAAEALGITVEAVNTGPVEVKINGRTFLVRGIFDAKSLDNTTDLDGGNLLPFDVESMARIQVEDEKVIALDSDPRLPAREMILTPLRALDIQVPNSEYVAVSVALALPHATYKEAYAAISSFLGQTGKPAYYGLDGVAYRGQRTRQTLLAGLIDLLVPLLIAALAVLNTMRGSVYERRDEIEVYNAVGIPPRYVFFIFFAEAFVYAVVGSVLGYLLSQGVGRVLTALDMTGGLNMIYTSIATVYASLAVAGTVCISSYFPARSAMNIAKPAEEAGWSLPEPEDDTLTFDLPFTFDYRDRMAVLTFVDRFLLDHGEGGAGRFTASTPTISTRVLSASESPSREVVPTLKATIWIKPFDLGVSQTMDVVMMHDAETTEFKARIALGRLSGTREAWLRLNHGFVAEIRRHFLHWRAVSSSDREAMFQEIRRRMEPAFTNETVPLIEENA